ncbi:branched-chain amino acid transaminase [Halomonas sp. 141]|uniref:Branched-chain-amino-acid aminotransferase n=2 Tax=Halomonadaceae TaxID=28256 RepID=A0A8H9I2Z8_9GAMM|nr:MULTISPECIES: branched-chain amino acid transaminase [Halomonas]NGO88169.1 branched-chain amino acid transaminase [Halomonas sp.]PJX12774.1 branched-chain amino acid transaminase [Halomonas sp. 141]GGW24504.1 branched chain amino acid aminotransferase [Halomonas hamiltonii]GGW43671.1 branched chain amino acid aminotransferase [Halomonas johnsoniae]
MADSLGTVSTVPRKPHPWVYLDGEIVPAAEALVPTTTQAFNYGTAVFEGIRAYASGNGQLNVFRLDDHLKRLEHSAKFLQLEGLPPRPEMRAIILDLLQRNQASTDSYIRPLAYKKTLLPGFSFGVKLAGVSTGLAINTLDMGAYMPANGIHCAVSSWRRIPDSSLPARAKITGSYANSALAMESAQRIGCDDALMLNVHGNLAESTSSNVFIVKGGHLITPPLSAHILEGITRDTVIKLARDELGMEVIERDVPFSELFSVEECFLSGTGVEIVPVTQIDHYKLQESGVGKVSTAIRRLYLESVRGLNAKYAHWLTPIFN